MCDDNYTVVLSKNHLTTIKEGKILLQGVRSSQDGLWDIPLQPLASTTTYQAQQARRRRHTVKPLPSHLDHTHKPNHCTPHHVYLQYHWTYHRHPDTLSNEKINQHNS